MMELVKTLEQMERELIIVALRAYDWNVSRAARAIGISRSGAYRKIKDHGIKKDEPHGQEQKEDSNQ